MRRTQIEQVGPFWLILVFEDVEGIPLIKCDSAWAFTLSGAIRKAAKMIKER